MTLDSVSGTILSTATIKPPPGMDFSSALACLSPLTAQNLVVDISSGNVYVMWFYSTPRKSEDTSTNLQGTQFILRVDWQSGVSSVAGRPDNMWILNAVRVFDPINQLYYFQGARTYPLRARLDAHSASTRPALPAAQLQGPIPQPRDGAQAP